MKCHSTPNVDDCSDYANGCRQHTWNQDHNHTGSREVLHQWKTGVLHSRVRAKPSVQPRRPAKGAGARSPDDAQPTMPLHLAGERPLENEGCRARRCCNAVVVSSVRPRGGATAGDRPAARRCWRPTSAFVVSLLIAALANILLSTSSSASPPMTVSKLWSTAFPRKVRGQKSSSGLLQKKMLEVQVSMS